MKNSINNYLYLEQGDERLHSAVMMVINFEILQSK